MQTFLGHPITINYMKFVIKLQNLITKLNLSILLLLEGKKEIDIKVVLHENKYATVALSHVSRLSMMSTDSLNG